MNMKTMKAGQRVFAAAFFAVLCGMWILWLLLGRFIDQENYENRELAEMPKWTAETAEQFPRDFENFFNDRLPFRNQMITLNSGVDYYVFGRSAHYRTMVGKDGWLFYSDSADGNPIACYQGTNLLPEEELKAIAANCLRQRDLLAEQGCAFVIYIAPNKNRVYPEYMPDVYGPPAETYRALQIVNYLRENTDLRVVYPYDNLMTAKSAVSEKLYYKTDTHWNLIGGYVGARTLLQELGIEIPELSDPSLKITQNGFKKGDLAKNLGLTAQLMSSDPEYTIEGYDTHGAELAAETDTSYLFRAEGADPRKLFVVRDSFVLSMMPYLSAQFNESYFKHFIYYLYEDFEAFQPDLFVYETVERYAANLRDFSIERGK